MQKQIDLLNSPPIQALFRVLATVLLLFISLVAFVAINALGDIKDLTSSINKLNIELTKLVGEGRVTANTVLNHEGRITSLELWRNTVPGPVPPR